MSSICKEAGLFTTIEQTVEGLSTPGKPDLRLDVVAFGGEHVSHYLIDVTCRNPYAMGITGITTDGAAADKGDKDKDRKYQQANRDIVVHPASLETFGRLSQRFHSLLIELDALATQHATARGLHAARFYRRWLTLINVALNKCLCRVFEETVCPHTKSIQDPLSTVSHKHLTAPNPNREDPPPPDLHLASPRHIPTRL